MRPEALKWDGSFSAVMQPPGAALRRGGKWQVELEARFANGDTTGAAVDIEGCREPVVASKKTGPREDEGAPFGQVVRAGESAKLAFAGATLEIPAGALDDDTRITIRPDLGRRDPRHRRDADQRHGGRPRLPPRPPRPQVRQADRADDPLRSQPVRGRPGGRRHGRLLLRRGRQALAPGADARGDASRQMLTAATTHFTDFIAGTISIARPPDRRQLQPELDQGPEGGEPDGGDRSDPAAPAQPRRRRAPLVSALGAAGSAGDAAEPGRDLQQRRGQRTDGYGLEPTDLDHRGGHALRYAPLQPDGGDGDVHARRRAAGDGSGAGARGPQDHATTERRRGSSTRSSGGRGVAIEVFNPSGGSDRLPLGGHRQERDTLLLRRDVQRARVDAVPRRFPLAPVARHRRVRQPDHLHLREDHSPGLHAGVRYTDGLGPLEDDPVHRGQRAARTRTTEWNSNTTGTPTASTT